MEPNQAYQFWHGGSLEITLAVTLVY